jgi:predicted TIM-barrel fold metal-dependent hydrolase
MRSQAKHYDELRNYLQTVPLIDCHDHSGGMPAKPTDPIHAVVDWYMQADLESAVMNLDMRLIQDASQPLADRWLELDKAWQRSKYTGYAEVVRRSLRHFYGEEDLTLEALVRISEKLVDVSDRAVYESVLDQAGIRVRIGDIFSNASAIDGSLNLPPRSRLAISLPAYHRIVNREAVQANVAPLRRSITSLDEYVEACRESFVRCKVFGAVCFKDQSAYERSIHFKNATRAEAEAAFNWFMQDPRRSLSYPEGNQPLGDYLFHQFMRMARDLDLPVQIHTGHMAGIYNDIVKTNALGLTSLLELHRDTRFDLFHANWPYSGDLLFLGKNYPNVAIDFCWTNMVDPIYSIRMFQQAISSMPHAKIHGYGSDLSGETLCSAWAHADLARDNIAIALAELVELEYIGLDDAKEIAWGWLYANPNEFFKLGIQA